MDLRRQLTVLRSWLWLLIGAVLLAGGAAYAVSSALPKVYEAQATLMVGQSLSAADPNYNDLLASQRLSQTYAELVTTHPLLEKVQAQLALDESIDELAGRVHADAPANSTMIKITADDGSPTRAADIANALSAALQAESPAVQGRQSGVQSFIDSDLQSTQQLITSTRAQADQLTALPNRTPEQDDELNVLEARLTSLRATYASMLASSSSSGASLLTVVEPATAPADAASPRVLLNTLLAMILGLLAAIGLAFLFEYLDDTVKGDEDVEAATGLATLGAITRMKVGRGKSEIYRLATILFPRSPAAEGYRTLRTNLEFADVDRAIQTLLVTSSIPGEGKTTTAANLAVAFAQAGRRTILVDADLRKPSVHKIFDIANEYGLSDLLRSDAMALSFVLAECEQPHLRILPTGKLPPNPAELLGSHRMRTILERLKGEADLVILDSPPLQAVTDPAVLGARVDGTLLVVDAGRTRRGALRHAREALSKTGARVLGVAINRLGARDRDAYYSYYGNYGAGGDRSKQPALEAAEQ